MTLARLPRSVWVPVLGLALVLFGWRINTIPLTNWDEGIYANVNLELFRSQDWTKLTYFGTDFLEKPPFQFWLTYPLVGIFGPTELAVRGWSVLAGIGTAMLLAVWGWQATGRRSVAWLAGFLFLGGRFTMFHAFRTGDLDGLLTLTIVLALYSYWRAWTAPRWMLVWGAATAAAIMTKSFVGLLPVIIAGADLLLSRGWRRIGWGNIAWGMAALVLLSVPWHLIETLRFGQAFWDSYLGQQVVERTTDSLFTATPWWYYLGVIRDRWYPFSYLFPLALVVAGWRIFKQRDALLRLLGIWLLVVLGVFTFIQTRREWYILPFYPAAVMLLAVTADRWWRARPTRWLMIVYGASVGLIAGQLFVDTRLGPLLARWFKLSALTVGFWTTTGGRLLIGGGLLFLLLGCAWVLRRWRWSMWHWTLGLSALVMVVMSLGWMGLYLRALPRTLPLKSIAMRIDQTRATRVSLIGTRLKKQPAGYFYILRLDTHSTEYVAGTSPPTTLVLTTIEALNVPLNIEGRVLERRPPFLLIDLGGEPRPAR